MTIKGLDAHICGDNCDPVNDRETHPMSHWHVSRHRDDDDVFITTGFWSALDYAATALSELAEFVHGGIGPMGEAGDYQSAYEAWVRSNELDALYQNVKHAGDQHSKADPDEDEQYDATRHRAPHYQGYGGDERIMETALRVVEQVNSESELNIWECTSELVYLNDAGTDLSDEDNGFPYHADDYYPPERFTRGDEPAAMTDR